MNDSDRSHSGGWLATCVAWTAATAIPTLGVTAIVAALVDDDGGPNDAGELVGFVVDAVAAALVVVAALVAAVVVVAARCLCDAAVP